MHILVITQYFWPENFRINDLAAGLVERGHKVTVLTGIPNYPHGRFFEGYGFTSKRIDDYRGCRVIRLPLIPRRQSSSVQLALNYLSYAAVATLLTPWIAGKSVDAVLVCQLSPATVGIPALVLKWFRRRPTLLWVLDLWPESLSATGSVKGSCALRMVGRLVSAIYRSADVVLASSLGFISKIEERGGPVGHTHYFPNWVEDVTGAPSGTAATLPPQIPPNRFKVMFAGNIGQAQNFETILAAAQRLKAEPNIQWLIVGDGRRREWVEQQIKVLGLENTVHLLGSHPPAAMPGLFVHADALLVTLRHDPLFALTAPGKLQSYMSTGKLIIAALEGEGRRVLEDAGAALVCCPEDPEALADAVMSAYNMPESQRLAMGESGRRYCAEHFDREKLLDRLESWLREAAISYVPGSRSDVACSPVVKPQS